GTVLVRDIVAGSGNLIFPAELTAMGGALYFSASDGVTGTELWRSDGTEAGTSVVKDIRSGSRSGVPEMLTAVGDTLYFTANDGSTGAELWESDGTADGTVLVADIYPGSTTSRPLALTPVGGVLFFTADDGTHGRELWKAAVNQPPQIAPIDDITSDEHVLVQVSPNVTDPEGDPFTLTWEGLPPGAVTDGGILSWTPDEAQGPGTYEITVTAAQDGAPALSDSETFTIAVLEVNEPPVLDPIPDVTVLTGDTVSFEATATDPDIPENSLTFSLGTAPAGATLAPLRPAEFSWTACVCPSGDHPVEVIVSDGELSDTLTFTIHVQNRPPQIDPIGDAVIAEGSPIQIQPVVSDPEGDSWTLAWSGDVPPNAAINGIFSWTPDEAQGPGDYAITVTASQDSEPALTASETFTISVEEVNQAPILDPIGPQSGVEGVPVEFQATAADPDIPVEALQFSMTPLAGDLSGAAIDADTGEFVCACATGQHLVRIWVSDGSLADFEDVEISVEAATAQADLQVSLAPSAPGQYFVGDAVPYTVLVHNAGPDTVTAELTVEPEHHGQATWGAVPPEAAINGIFFLSIGEIAAGTTIPVEFEIVYGAFGFHDLTATVSGSHEELAPANDLAIHEQQVDLSLNAAGVQAGGLAIDGTNTIDGQPLAIFGVSVPSRLIAGDPGWNLFLPSDLTPPELIAGEHFLPGDQWIAGEHSVRGVVLIPALDGSSKLPPGRLLFSDGSGTDALVSEPGDTSLRVERAWTSKITPGGLSVTQADGGVLEGSVALCGGAFQARLGSGNGAGFECGSLTTTVLTGQVSIELGDTLLTAPAGSVVHVTEADGGGWEVTVNQGGPITLTNEGETTELGAGESTHIAAAGTPTADPGGPYLGAVSAPIALDGSASSDPDDEPLTYAWSADGGTITGSTSATPSFTASAAGIFALTMEVCDPSGACDTAITSVVVYDPSAGFVTGGGWIDSQPGSCGPAAPEGVCVGDPTGRATFGFVSRYKKGADLPDGQTEFVFQAGLRFHSDSYEWLVVAGKDRAQFKGIGAVNGVDGYEFMLTAYDSGGTGPDGFRIKIWNEIGVVYDNRSGADDSLAVADTQAIGGGSIVIHRK
ncbi:MAG TPA: ELWxxDGT repeat protein, partial [Candidatus Limnocylindria bacterium]